VTAFLERALTWFESHGTYAKRVMTDNAFSYGHNRSLPELLAAREIKHLRTQAYRPQTNGKVERFRQIMAREWADGMSYRSSRHRDRALPHWLERHNTRRPHSGIGNRPPVSRVHDLCEQDS
jgi:transposase InsO family protein